MEYPHRLDDDGNEIEARHSLISRVIVMWESVDDNPVFRELSSFAARGECPDNGLSGEGNAIGIRYHVW